MRVVELRCRCPFLWLHSHSDIGCWSMVHRSLPKFNQLLEGVKINQREIMYQYRGNIHKQCGHWFPWLTMAWDSYVWWKSGSLEPVREHATEIKYTFAFHLTKDWGTDHIQLWWLCLLYCITGSKTNSNLLLGVPSFSHLLFPAGFPVCLESTLSTV